LLGKKGYVVVVLGQDHLTALSDLFGWDVPPEDQVRVVADPVIIA